MADPHVGQTLANRYRLNERVGEGGMAVVYRGKDTLLGRPVAVKILRDQYASDKEFVDRFRLEAQTAASLAHPNVVNTYDVGTDDGVHYIVMEMVEGENLKERIRRAGRLSPAESISIGTQIARALSAAHGMGLIHRDIKPHNILLTPDGTVKVADFGIARAQSSASMTQTGMIIGSVHYFSPQQARGERIDGASDLYSLGVLLYEMVTGELPFSGDTPVGIALKHINETPREPRSMTDEVPEALNDLIMRLLAKEPKERGGSAKEVLGALTKMSDGVDSTPPGRSDLPKGTEVDATQRMPAISPDDHTLVQSVGELEENEMTQHDKSRRRRRRLAILVVLFLSFAAGLTWAAQKLPEMIFPEEVRVPEITGVDLETARARLAQQGLRLHPNIRDVYSKDVPAGLVMRQSPDANDRVRMGREIQVTVSRGPEYVVVPDVVGVSKVEAQLQITQQNLTVGDVTEEFNPEVPPNTVVGQDPPGGTRLEESNAVDIVVARGSRSEPTVQVPDVRGMALQDAKRVLEELGLIEGQLHGEPHPSAPANQVIDQNPQPGEEVEVGYPYGLAYAVRPASSTGSSPSAGVSSNVQEKYWESRVLIVVPDGPPQEIVILVTDDWGPRQVLREVRQGGSRFYQSITVRGDRARVQVWMDGVPHMNEEIRRTAGG